MSAPAKSGSSCLREQPKRTRLLFTALLVVVGVLSAVMFFSTRTQHTEVFEGLPHRYTYLEAESLGKVQLHMMSLSPDDVKLQPAGSPLQQVASYGINGGFFYGTDLLSIAIMNDTPVSGKKHGYGSGWFNAKYPRGTLVWDGADRKFSVQVVSSGDQLAVSDRSQFFAQGGISMNLAHEELWEPVAALEHLPYPDEQRMRSGMVYDDTGKLWLIVTPTLSTAAEFRAHIRDRSRSRS